MDRVPTHTPESAIRAAVAAIGSQVATGRLLGVSQQSVSWWIRKGELPPEHVLAVEAASGVSKHDLRPDIYPRESAPAAPGIAFEHAR